MIRQPLVIGYGNVLRRDDGIGPRVAADAAIDPRLVDASTLLVHQLVPELAFDLSAASIVVFVDARVGPAPGSLAVERVKARASASSPWSHHVDPGTLAAMAEQLYGRVPPVYLVTVGVASMELGDGLTPAVEACVPRAIDAVCALVAGLEPSERPSVAGHA
jgi:hydrogenase maturation protease